MAKRKMPDPQFLHKLLSYDAETGKLYWRERHRGMFKNNKSYGMWNTRYANQPAFTAINQGYLQGCVYKHIIRAHRVIWAMHYGEWPVDDIDHINGIRNDNRICNLRIVTRSENLRNQKRSSKNTSGVTGVYWHKATGRWMAQLKVHQKTVYLGRFDTIEAAVAARKEGEKAHGFHENHGRL